MELPQQINQITTSGRKTLYFALVFFGTWIISSFLFNANFPYHILAGIGSILLGISLIVLFTTREYRKKGSILLSENGILETKGGKEIFISWDEMHQTYYNATTFTKIGLPVATITKTQVLAPGRRIFVNHPSAHFHKTLVGISQERVLPIIIRELEAGKNVYFGPIELSRDKIFIKKESYLLSEISSMKVDNGILKVKFKADWFSSRIPVSDVPNLLCLLSVIKVELE